MARLTAACWLSLLVPASAPAQPIPPLPAPPDAARPAGDGAPPVKTGYVAPKADGPVVELLDEDVGPLIAELTNDTGRPDGRAVREAADVFAGVEAVRVLPQQRLRTRMPGWGFKVVEKPARPGEYRYLRFAWKKQGGGIIVLAFATDGGQWLNRRYVVGPYDFLGSGVKVAAAAPTGWTLVTRDLFEDFGPLTVDGILLGVDLVGEGFFDHVLLGRTLADLDRATDVALGRVRPDRPLSGAARDALWADLIGPDPVRASAAFRAFLSDAAGQVDYIRDRLPADPSAAVTARVRTLVKDLDDDRFVVRERATRELRSIGPPAARALKAAAESSPSAEVRHRAETVLRAVSQKAGETPPEQMRAARVARLLERANTIEARDLLARLAAGDYGHDYSAEARAARARVSAASRKP